MSKTINDIVREVAEGEGEALNPADYDFVLGCGDTITCDDCYNISHNWFTGENRAICEDCYESKVSKQ